MYRRLLQHHTLANLAFALVLVLGGLAYLMLPRQQAPSINFHWVEIHTRFPGASAADVEERVTNVLEEAVARVPDIRYSASASRTGFSRIMVRFRDLNEDAFDERVAALRREIQTVLDELPEGASQPQLFVATSDNYKPAVLLLVVGRAQSPRLMRQAERVAEDLERLTRVGRVDLLGLRDRELQVRFHPARMQGLGVSPAALANTVSAYFRDVAAGTVRIGDREWLVRFDGTDNDLSYLANLPITAAAGEVPLGSVADIVRGLEEPAVRVAYRGRPAVLLAVFKKTGANLLTLVEQIAAYSDARNQRLAANGIELVVLDDQTEVTRRALSMMKHNAVIGFALVMLTAWLFFGTRVAFFTSLGVPFALAGTFLVLATIGQTLNVVVLLGVVIALGMLVDDTIVVVEAIYFRLQRGVAPLDAAVAGVKEVAAPLTTSILTAAAAFLPLMMLPGILGDFMRVAPLVVIVALAFSLIEDLWMLPSHLAVAGPPAVSASRIGRLRTRAIQRLRTGYARLLIAALRRPRRIIFGVLTLMALAAGILQGGLLRVDFFATDSARLFYVNVKMPAGTALEKTLQTTMAIEQVVRARVRPQELRAMASYAGVQFTETSPLRGGRFGQITVSLKPRVEGGRTVNEIIEGLGEAARRVPGPVNISFLRLTTGPPTLLPVSVKLRGNNLERLAEAAAALKGVLRSIKGVRDIRDDSGGRRMQLRLRLDLDAVARSGLNPATLIRNIRLLTDGAVVASMQYQGTEVDVRVVSDRDSLEQINAFLHSPVNLPDGSTVSLGQLVHAEVVRGRGVIRHQNFRRAITVTAGLNEAVSDTLTVNQKIRERWQAQLADRFPHVTLNFAGELDDIKESLSNIGLFLLLGIGLIYLILGAQFRSYLQPLIVLPTVPLAFTGAVFGLFVSDSILSLYTLYGVVGLAGVSVNSAIVLVSAANDRIHAGMSLGHATVLAARRRVVPVLITQLTTIAGLFSLAMGFAGESKIWGPVASAIVWGLGLSTALTLFVTPLLYTWLAPRLRSRIEAIPLPPALERRRSRVRAAVAWLRNPQGMPARYRADLAILAYDHELAAAYCRGREALCAKDFMTALKLFQYVAEKKPSLVLVNRAAAHAALAVINRDGWDHGYDARARRFLSRASRLEPELADLIALKRLYVTLRRGNEEDGEETAESGVRAPAG